MLRIDEEGFADRIKKVLKMLPGGSRAVAIEAYKTHRRSEGWTTAELNSVKMTKEHIETWQTKVSSSLNPRQNPRGTKWTTLVISTIEKLAQREIARQDRVKKAVSSRFDKFADEL